MLNVLYNAGLRETHHSLEQYKTRGRFFLRSDPCSTCWPKASLFTLYDENLCPARIRGKDATEIVIPGSRPATGSGIGQIQQRPVLSILTKVILTPRDVVAFLPEASPTLVRYAEERVEDSWLEATTGSGIISRRDQLTANTGEAIADGRILDARQVRFEC